MSNPTDTPSRRRVTVEQFDRIERKLDAVLSLLRGDQGRSGAASVRTLADGSTFVPGTGILGDPDAPRVLTPEAVAALEALDADDDGAPFLALANGDDPSPSETTKVVAYPAGAEEPDWFHDPIGGRWVGPVGDGTVFVEIFADELASLTAAVAEATEGDER